METGIKSSFIPRDATIPAAPSYSRGPGLSDLFVLIAIVLLVASVALAVGVFLYEQFLKTSTSSKLEQLERAKAAFEPALIQELTRLDDRMSAADQVLSEHIAPSIFFHLLEQLTLQTVAFTNLDFQAVDAHNMNVKMRGIAMSVNSIALQADYLSKSGAIASPIFSNINRQIDGVHFDLGALVNPSALRYGQFGAVAAPEVQEQQQPTGALPLPPEGLPESTDAQ
ncbi:MAG: hypothetical protein G01um10148_656 [Parcubacteria group bacterium Gr01-1014_8]|nr:MAG: hypothetical protein G01um10148_656 [Parcubacteria group bacterium Gr01-1014_8]